MYDYKELNIISDFDIFNVNFIKFNSDFFDLYYEKDNKFYQFYIYLSDENEIPIIVFKNYTAYRDISIYNCKSKLNFFEFLNCLPKSNYDKKFFNQLKKIKDNLKDNYVEYMI